jgi:hypothetical protein
MAQSNNDGCRLVGFDGAGYPLVERGYKRLPDGFHIKRAYKFGVEPMKLAAKLAKPAGSPPSANLPITAKLKPAPSVPAAPDDLPAEYDFCVHQSSDGTRFLRFRDPNHFMHGKDITASSNCIPARMGSDDVTMCHGGQGDIFWKAPVCSDSADDKDPVPTPCCVDQKTSMLVCPGSTYDSLVVEILPQSQQSIAGVVHVSVKHPDLPGGGLRAVPICEPIEPDFPEGKPCCIDEETGAVVCRPEWTSPFEGKIVPLEYLKFSDEPDGTRVALVDCGLVSGGPVNEVQAALLEFCGSVGGFRFNVCEKITPTPDITPRPEIPEVTPLPEPEPVPDLCCFDPQTKSIICEGSRFHGLVVRVVTITTLPDGTKIASVEHPELPGGGARLPFCMMPPEVPPDISELPEVPEEIPEPEPDEPEPEPEPEPEIEPVPDLPPPSPGLPEHCCYDRIKQVVDCPGTELHGLRVRLVQEGAVKNGWPMVKVEHPKFPGGYAVMPVCRKDCEGIYQPPRPPGPTCADKWEREKQRIIEASDAEGPGRRYSAIQRRYCKGGIGIGDQHKDYGRFPGLRGGRRSLSQ